MHAPLGSPPPVDSFPPITRFAEHSRNTYFLLDSTHNRASACSFRRFTCMRKASRRLPRRAPCCVDSLVASFGVMRMRSKKTRGNMKHDQTRRNVSSSSVSTSVSERLCDASQSIVNPPRQIKPLPTRRSQSTTRSERQTVVPNLSKLKALSTRRPQCVSILPSEGSSPSTSQCSTPSLSRSSSTSSCDSDTEAQSPIPSFTVINGRLSALLNAPQGDLSQEYDAFIVPTRACSPETPWRNPGYIDIMN